MINERSLIDLYTSFTKRHKHRFANSKIYLLIAFAIFSPSFLRQLLFSSFYNTHVGACNRLMSQQLSELQYPDLAFSSLDVSGIKTLSGISGSASDDVH